MSRAEKIHSLSKFFNDEVRIMKQETKIVFRVTANGKLIEPKAMTEQQFEDHVNNLRTQYADVLVWEEDKEYEQ
jgi:hypothetical protein